MWRVTLKGLLAHRVRLVLTTVSVVLGVAFVAGTFVLTDTMSSVFDDLVRGGTESIDVLVRDESAADRSAMEELDAPPPPLPEDLVDEVRAVDGVADARGGLEGYALLVRPDGEPIVPMGPPTLGTGWSDDAQRTIRDGGRAPTGPDEVVIDASTADRNGLGPGDRVTIVFASIPPREFSVVGITTKEGGDNLAGATLAEFEHRVAQEVLGLEGHVTGISVWADPGVEPQVLVERLEAAFDVDAITAADWADESMASIDEALGYITILFGVFAGIALFVGAFIIANTFSITVLQRTREFALLRSLGATRRQILSGVVGEAVLIGLAASAVGVLAGLGLATALEAMLGMFGLDMPSGPLVLRPRTVVVALTIGLVVTVVSSLLPARRAAATHPMAALRAAATQAYRPSRARLAGGIAAAVAGAALLAVAVVAQPDGAGAMVGGGAVLAVVALAATGPALTRPVLRLFGGSGTRLGTVGRLARSNSLRTPRRTWTTAAALTIGLALVSSVAVIGASMKVSASEALDGTLRADAIVTPSNQMMGGTLPPVLSRELAEAPEVAALSPLRGGLGEIDGASATLLAVDPAGWGKVAATTFVQGTLADLALPGTVAVDVDLVRERGYRVGDEIDASFPADKHARLEVAAVFEPDAILTGWLTGTATHEQLFDDVADSSVLIVGGDTEPGAVLAAVERVAQAYPAVLVQDQTQFRASVAAQVDQLLALVTALLGMALFIAVLGIMNTLALSIHERTHEIGLLRAVGATRRQVRGMVRWEAVTVALLGAVVGLLLGALFGWATTRALADQGMATFALPVGQLLGAVLLAALAGVLAAVLPARSAARLDVLRAVTAD